MNTEFPTTPRPTSRSVCPQAQRKITIPRYPPLELQMTPRKLFKGDFTILYNNKVRDITIIGSKIVNGKTLLKVIDHSDRRYKHFIIDKIKQENLEFKYVAN